VCHALEQDPRFFTLLLQIDRELAALTQAGGCACSGRLHCADYPRKPRGVATEWRAGFERRFSFCCSVCRKRTTAESVRFLGRRVYLALVVVLSSSRHAGSNSGTAAVRCAVAVPLRTLERWRSWWQEAFIATPLWRGAGGSFMPPLDAAGLPANLLERFVGDAVARLSGLLRWLGPLTVRAADPAAEITAEHAA
jgi:hypothetical protein